MAVKTRHSFRKWVALAAALFFLPLCGLGVFLGVAVIEMPPSDPLLGETRLVVGKVLEQGLAYGLLQPGDVLLRVAREGAKVLALQKSQQLGEFLEECSPEQVLLFHVLRDQQPMEVRVPLKKEPPSAPFFRFHSSMHLSEIRDLSVHPFGEWLATVSLDKTLKLWRLPELELFQTVHFPSDSGDSGKMYAVAFSPDGSELACAGWGGDWQSGQCVFLLDTSTWQVKQVLEGMPDIAFSLEYSPGGEWLCAALGGGGDFYLFSRTGSPSIRAPAALAGSHGARFSPDGSTIVSTGKDRTLRLYRLEGNQLQLVQSRSFSDRQPFGVSFSPDGYQLAVGFLDAPGIFLLDPQTLQTTSLVADSTRGNQTWHHVFWTKSGGTLFACSYGADPSFSWWNQAGAGERHTASLGTQLLKAIDLGERRVAFCTEKPSLGVFSLDSEEILQLQAPIAFGGAIDPYGMWLEERSGRLFLPQPDGNTLLCLDTNFSTLSLFDLSSTPGSLPILGTTRLPRVFCDTLPLTVDAHFRSILFRGQPLCLEPGETTSCLCIFPDDSGFAVGSNWNVRTFDALGNPLWVFSAPAGVLSLQVSSQEGAVFASLADGTVRRFDLDTGEEHQTWLVSSEMEWLCVQQNGAIRHSSRGWQLGGWHSNRGPAQTALFEPLQPLPAPQTPAIAPVPQRFPPEPQRIFAVLCAVEDGSSTQPALRYVKDDARAMRTMLQNYSARRKIPLHTFELENESVSHEALEGVFGQIAGQCGPHDALLFFFAGHASYSPGAGGVPLFQLLAPNFSGEGLALTTLAGWLEKPPLSRALLLFDCCYSGCASDFFAGCSALSDLSLAVFTSSSPLQKSPELDSLGHGLLSASILDAMCSPGASLFHPGFVAGLFQSHARLQTTFPQDPVPLGFFVRP